MKNKMNLSIFAIAIFSLFPFSLRGEVYQATGFKTGEMTDTSAIIWTRLTRNKERNSSKGSMVKIKYGEKKKSEGKGKAVIDLIFPEGETVDDLRSAVPGAKGEVNLSYRVKGNGKWLKTGWKGVDPDRDFTHQFRLDSLKPGTKYEVIVESRSPDGKKKGESLTGGFKTAPSSDTSARVSFAVSTGQKHENSDSKRGFKIYDMMLEQLDLDFFVHTGDIIYYDQLAKNIDLARYHWHRIYSLPGNVDFHKQVGSYFMKDDHDTWKNDCWPTMKSRFMYKFTFKQGVKVFLEQVPMGKLTYRTRRWGKDLQIWMVEGRDFRSANTDPDGPEKTIWGKEQKEWFKRTVRKSDAVFKVLISPTPIIGPDRGNKSDNHANRAFTHEGDEIRKFLGEQKNMVVVCGDRHWQYISTDLETGVREYCCGPTSNKHAGGAKSKMRNEMTKYFNVVGGVMTCTVQREKNVPIMTVIHYSPKGEVLNEDLLRAE